MHPLLMALHAIAKFAKLFQDICLYSCELDAESNHVCPTGSTNSCIPSIQMMAYCVSSVLDVNPPQTVNET